MSAFGEMPNAGFSPIVRIEDRTRKQSHDVAGHFTRPMPASENAGLGMGVMRIRQIPLRFLYTLIHAPVKLPHPRDIAVADT